MDAVAATVLGLAGLLGLISLLPPLAERLRVPYTVLLAALGCALGVTFGFNLAGLGVVGDFLVAVDAIEVTAAAFLTIFLPVLLFDTALGLDARALFEDLAPILLLAVVAVVVTTVVAGFAVWGAAGWLAPGLTLAACLLLASIVATTDPAAVVAIFREVGAPQRLSNLVEGESLLNDAAAIALFGLFLAVVIGVREPDLGEGASVFLREFAGGTAFGFLAGRLAAAVAIRLGDLRSAEITLSLALPYLTYVLAQSYLHVSGVVAVVVAALAFGAYGRVGLAPAGWQALTAIWHQLGFWASSLVFVLASMLVPRTLQSLTPGDAGLLLVLVAAALVARAVVLYGLLPGLSALGLAQRVSGPYKAVMLWGGLRGAVTLALALGVTESYLVAPEIKRHVAVLATGFVLFTLFVQAPTLRPLLRWFRLDRLPPAERAMRARVMALSFDDILERLHTAAEAYRVEEGPSREVEGRYRERQARLGDGQLLAVMPANQLYIGLGSIANREAELYREHFDERMISRRIAAQLARQVSALLDGLKTGGPYGYAVVARAQAGFGPRFRLALWLHDRARVHRPLAHRLADRFEILLVQGKVLRELRAFTEASLRPLLGETIALELDRALAGRLELAETALAALKLQYPDYGRRLEARYLERAALRMEDAAYRRLFAESVIGREVFNSLMRDLRARRREADREPRLDLGMEVDDLVRRVPLFAAIDEAGIREIAGLVKPRLGVPGELLVRRGARNDRRMFFVASGAVEVDVPPKPVRLGTGDFFGELALLTKRPRNADVTMIGYGKLLVLEGRDFHRFLRTHPDIRERIHEVARARQGLRRGA